MTCDYCEKFCGVRLRVLPDFLLDHTLLGEEAAERLVEQGQRWEQFIRRLSIWENVTFCFRFHYQSTTGEIGVFLLANPRVPEERDRLQGDLEFALTAFGILNDFADQSRCARLLSRLQMDKMHLVREKADKWMNGVKKAFDAALSPLPEDAAFVGVIQKVSDDVWTNQDKAGKLVKSAGPGRSKPCKPY